jgi:phosphoribosyl-AMP cyclohydrolase
VFWSRSRQALWRKGESSGNVQKLVELRLDCDGDTLLMQVEQQGPACHTGRANCFYRQWTGEGWDSTEPVVRSPEEMYGSGA